MDEAPPSAAPPTAGRLVFKPLRPTPAERRAASAQAALAAAATRNFRTGDVVTAQGDSFILRRAEPRGLRRVDATTEVEFDFSPDPPKRAIADVAFLIDASWSMRRADLPPTRLEAARRALATALANAGDVVRRASVVAFAGGANVVAPLAPPPSVDLPALDALVPRGPGKLVPALDATLEHLAHDADPGDEHAVFLATDSEAHGPHLVEAGARAVRLGVQVHVLDMGSPQPAQLERLAAETGGTYHDAHGGVTFRPALHALASRFGVPLPWRDPSRATGEVEFEIVLRAMTEREVSEFPALPKRLRRK